MLRPFRNEELGTPVCRACDLVKTFGEEEKLGNCCLVMDCFFVGFANAQAKAIMEVHSDSWIVAICTSQN